jgi:uncharacterized protein involved in outer membrane biogenesis
VNSLYIGIGVGIIVALVTALVGPYFVDWTAYRSVFEREGQRIFGENVTVLGQAQVRLLPMPSISLSDVVIGPVDQPDLKIDRLELQIEPTPLLKGEIRISELRLDRPVVRMGLDADGAPVLPGLYASMKQAGQGPDVGAIGLEFAEIVDGRVLLFDKRSGAEASIEGLNGTASAAALAGPLKLDGGASLNGHAFTFHFATGKRGDDGQWSMRLQASPVEAPFQLNIEATLATATAVPKATGTLTLQRLSVGEAKGDKFSIDPTPWQLDSAFAADAKAIAFDDLHLSVGEAETAYSITGKGRVDIGAQPKFDVDLAAKEVDLDRLIARKIDEPTDPQIATGRLESLFLGLPKLPLVGRVHLGVSGVVIGGGAVQDVDLDIKTRSDGWTIDNFAARLPGRSRLQTSGRLVVSLTPSTSPTFSGDITLASDQPTALLTWWMNEPAPPLDPFSFSGRVAISEGDLRVDELRAKLGAASANGALQWVAATQVTPARLKATISADQLDLDQAKVISGLMTTGLGASPATHAEEARLPLLDLDLDAGAVLVAGQSLKGVAAKLAFDGSTLTIDKLTIRDAIGAGIDIKGRIDKLMTTPDGSIDGSIRADRLAGLAHLLETLAPGSTWIKRLVAAAPALGPINATARVTGDGRPEGSDVHLTLNGMAGQSRLAVDARFGGRLDHVRDGTLDASLQLDGPDGGLVLRQIGIPAISDTVSAGKLVIAANGTSANGLQVTATADIGGSKVTLGGQAQIDAAGAIAYNGDIKLTSADLRLPATMFGQSLPSGGAAVPADLHAHIVSTGLKAKVTGLGGHLSEAGVVGGADVDLTQWPVRVDGNLQLTQADLQTLLEIGIGADAFQAPVSRGQVWPSDVLAGPAISWLNGNIDFKADRLTIDPTRGFDRFATKLRFRPGRLLFDSMAGRLANGNLTGALGLSVTDAGEIGLTGNVQLKGARLADVVWRRDDRAVADGTMELTATFDSTGRSIAALAADLNGSGALNVTDGMMRYVDPDAFGAIIAAADGGMDLKDDKIRSVFQGRLDAGTLPFQRIEAAFSIGSGVLRVGNIVVTSPRAQAGGSVSLDFGRWTMDADWTLKVDPGRNGVVGAEPQVGVLFKGPLDAPKRTIDVAPLSAFLTLRAFEREVQRVEDLQADIVEQQRFQRELKRLKDERQRRDQEQKAADAAAKQKAIDDAKKPPDAPKAPDAQKIDDARKTTDALRTADDQKAAETQKASDLREDDARRATEAQAVANAPGNADAKRADDLKKPQSSAPTSSTDASAAPAHAVSQAEPHADDKASTDQVQPSAAKNPEAPATPAITPAPASNPPAAAVAPMPVTTQTARARPAQPNVLPDLPPIIFITPKAPIMPLAVPNSPTVQ